MKSPKPWPLVFEKENWGSRATSDSGISRGLQNVGKMIHGEKWSLFHGEGQEALLASTPSLFICLFCSSSTNLLCSAPMPWLSPRLRLPFA